MKFRVNTTTERIENTGGLILAGAISKKIGLHFTPEEEIPHSEVIRSMFGLLIQGRTSYEEIDLFRGSDLFRNSFDLSYVPAKEILRLYLKRISELRSRSHTALNRVNMNLLKKQH